MAPNRASDHATQYRTHSCGELRAEHAAKPGARPAPPPIADELDVLVPRRPAAAGATIVTLSGYVDERVDEFSFLLRDHYGRTLVKADQAALPYVPDRFKKAGREDVVQVTGAVQLRLSADPGLQTGEIEVVCTQIEPLSVSAEPPPPDLLGRDAGKISADAKLLHRQLYLRRPEMQQRLSKRAQITKAAREYLTSNDFFEVETPHLFWYDPVAIGGEVVPAGNGRAWRTPSGPVVLDQYLIGGGFDRAFQFSCTTRRENSPGPLHGQEHTSLDINLAYADVDDMCARLEDLVAHLFTAAGKSVPRPFPRFTYDDAMVRFGTERPEIRFPLEIVDLGDAQKGKVTRGLRALLASDKISDADLDKLCKVTGGVTWAKVAEKEITGTAAGLLKGGEVKKKLGAAANDVVLIATGSTADEASALSAGMRLRLGEALQLVDKDKHAACWVESYPFLELDKGTLVARVVVFSRPIDEDMPLVPDRKQRAKIRARAFDLIVDGTEVASGYVGNHSLVEQRVCWDNILGIGQQDLFRVRAPIEAFRFGVPPHGGVNIGYERLVGRILGVDDIADVMAFPKSATCTDPMLQAPGPVPPSFVADLVSVAPSTRYGIPELAEDTNKL
jgi:aspartyl-tRNA synthetase